MPAVAAGARYWSDEAYSKFYGGSEAEQGLVNRPACGSAESLSSRQLDDFQAAFAEWSAGAGQLRAPDFRRFLLQLGLDLSPAQARALWAHAAPPDAREAAPPPHLGHAQVLELYRQVLENPLEFKTGLRACPPGKAPAEAPPALGAPPPCAEPRPRRPAAGRFGSRGGSADAAAAEPVRRPGGGLHLPVHEARELLLSEALPATEVEAALRPFAGSGGVPQSLLFDLLEQHTGAPDVEGGEPRAALRPDRLRPAAAPPSAAARPPALA